MAKQRKVALLHNAAATRDRRSLLGRNARVVLQTSLSHVWSSPQQQRWQHSVSTGLPMARARVFILSLAVILEVSVWAMWSKHTQNWANLLDKTGIFTSLTAPLSPSHVATSTSTHSPSPLSFSVWLVSSPVMIGGLTAAFYNFWAYSRTSLSWLGPAPAWPRAPLPHVPLSFLCCFPALPLTWHRVLQRSGHYFVTLGPTLRMLWNHILIYTK